MKIILFIILLIFFGNMVNGAGWREAVKMLQDRDE